MGLEVRTFITEPDHADPLGNRITVGVDQRAEESSFFFGKLSR